MTHTTPAEQAAHATDRLARNQPDGPPNLFDEDLIDADGERVRITHVHGCFFMVFFLGPRGWKAEAIELVRSWPWPGLMFEIEGDDIFASRPDGTGWFATWRSSSTTDEVAQ